MAQIKKHAYFHQMYVYYVLLIVFHFLNHISDWKQVSVKGLEGLTLIVVI